MLANLSRLQIKYEHKMCQKAILLKSHFENGNNEKYNLLKYMLKKHLCVSWLTLRFGKDFVFSKLSFRIIKQDLIADFYNNSNFHFCCIHFVFQN